LSVDRYDQISTKLTLTSKDVIIGTDQNFDYLKIQQHTHTSDLLNNFFAAGMVPTITRPTRVTATSSTLIDNIYVNFKADLNNIFSGVICSDISDHFPVFMFYGKEKVPKNKPITYNSRKLNDYKIQLINNLLFEKDWTFLQHLHVNDAWNAMINIINESLDKIAPLQRITIRRKQQIICPSFTRGLVKSLLIIFKGLRLM